MKNVFQTVEFLTTAAGTATDITQTITAFAGGDAIQTTTVPAGANVIQTTTVPAGGDAIQTITSQAGDDTAHTTTSHADADTSRTVTAQAGADTIRTITVQAGTNLLDACREHRILIEAACGGAGICGKCQVQVLRGDVPASEEDRRFFTAQELAAGYRLACRIKMVDDVTVRIQNQAMNISSPVLGSAAGKCSGKILADMENLSSSGLESAAGKCCGKTSPDMENLSSSDLESAAGKCFRNILPISKNNTDSPNPLECYIAVDLGSTTLAAAVMKTDGTILSQASAVNSQRIYGADVISRMQASNEGKREELKACICRDLENLFQTLIYALEKSVFISRIAIAANTVMMHLLRGYSCEKLGQAPFEPVNLDLECLRYEDLFMETPGCGGSRVYLLPGLSAFIGADIAAGLYSSGFGQATEEEPAFFVDLGTNGELAFGSPSGFVTASAAAGPAFEGGRLSCGVPAVPGAVCSVSFLYHRVRVQTIGQKKPCGICGTGALEAVAALLKEKRMDADGLLAPELSERGLEIARREDGSRICLTQADIREIQMAKAAIRAGIEILQREYQKEPACRGRMEGSRIYLAGGFGCYLSAETAAAVGLFPAEWKDRIVTCGNTSLKGAAAFLTDASCAPKLEKMRGRNRTIRLEDSPQFGDIFVREMGFGGT